MDREQSRLQCRALRAAESVVAHAAKAIKIEDIEARVSALDTALVDLVHLAKHRWIIERDYQETICFLNGRAGELDFHSDPSF